MHLIGRTVFLQTVATMFIVGHVHFGSTLVAQTVLKDIDCTLEPNQDARRFQQPVRPTDGLLWKITNRFANVVTSKDVPGLPAGDWQHTGVDYLLNGSGTASQDRNVNAVGNGVVVFSTLSNKNPLPKRGGLVIIRHRAPVGHLYQVPEYIQALAPTSETVEVFSYYLHLNPDYVFVKQGDQVTAGQSIARLYSLRDFSTKFAYVPHLHFELWKSCGNIERNGYDSPGKEFEIAVTYQLIDPSKFLSLSPAQVLFARDLIKLIESCKYGGDDCWVNRVAAQIKAGADSNAKSESGRSALQLALAYQASTSVIRMLIDAGADVNYRNNSGETPLMVVVDLRTHAKEYVNILIDAGANVNATNSDGWTALMRTAYNGSDPQILRVLIKAGANANLESKNGETALTILQTRIRRDKAQGYSFASNAEMLEVLRAATTGNKAIVR